MDKADLIFTLRSRLTLAERSALKDNTVTHINWHNLGYAIAHAGYRGATPMPVDTLRARHTDIFERWRADTDPGKDV